MAVNFKNMVEYCSGLESTGVRVIERINRFNNSVPSVEDIDNNLDYLTNLVIYYKK